MTGVPTCDPSHHGSLSAVTADVGEDRVVVDHLVGVRLVFAARARHHAEEAGLRVDRAQAPVGADVQPAMSSPIVQTFQPGIVLRRDQHREVGLAAGGRERRGDVMHFAPRALDADDQHVLGEPAFACAPASSRCAARGTSCRAARCRRSRSRRS